MHKILPHLWRYALIAAIAIVATIVWMRATRSPAETYASLVDSKGSIRFPVDFPTGFVHMGTWAVAGGGGVADVHAVYGRASDVTEYRDKGAFPDGAVLIKEVSETIGSTHTTGKAFWGHQTKTWFVMVKDAKNRFPSNPLWGDGWGWAQFDPADRTRQIATDYTKDCKTCHVPAQASDWIYVYAYPILGKAATAFTPKAALPVAGTGEGHRAATATESNTSSATKPGNDDGAIALGKQAFEESCIGCHSIQKGENKIGPSLFGVIGRKAGGAPNYAYSEAMNNTKVIWSRSTLIAHLTDTRNFIPGNRMGLTFAGVDDTKKREQIAAYLETVK